MLVPVVRVMCSILMSIVGLLVVKKLSGSNEKLLKLKNIVLMSCLITFPVVAYYLSYEYIYSIILYVITIVTYKYILNISVIKSTLVCGLMLLFVAILDFISMCFLVCFISMDTIRNTWYINISSNILFSVVLLAICYKTKIGNSIEKVVEKISNKKQTKIVFFFALVLVAMSIVLYIASKNFEISSMFTTNMLLFIIFFLLVIILFTERSSYDKLSDEYDTLFECVKVFEEWIEKEQFVRHEYKNELAAIRQMTRNRNIHQKIDEIVEEIIDVDEEMIQTLKGLPNGGLKGLLYYKIIVARNKNVHLEFDISEKVYALFTNLDESKLRVLSKLVGVYCDNAIEAANDTQKRIVTIEIYNLNNEINFVISNTYNTQDNLSNINEKGVSTKGEGRGNGLYYASKLLHKNNWIITKQSTIKNIYIQKVIIK